MSTVPMNTIVVTINGPLECHGDLEIVGADGAVLATQAQAWLCRCGRSAGKPYCDGSHKKVSFTDTTAHEAAPMAQGAAAGVLRVVLRRNGPLLLEGPCEVRHPAAGVIYAGSQTALCRCGQSGKKPYCDGTHRQIGFVA
jgi:CDGSH-type Zn-finger protein